MIIINNEFLDKLNLLIESLKLAQRAELTDSNSENIIEELYVDPLPNQTIFKQVISDSTIFLIGRKGTGKSTVFARAQEYFRHQKMEVSVYIDVKTLYGKSIAQELKLSGETDNIQKLLLLQNFISDVLNELISELEKNLDNKNLLGRLLNSSKFKEVKKELTIIKNKIRNPNFYDVTLSKSENVETKNNNGFEKMGINQSKIGVKASNIKGSLNGSIENTSSFKSNEEGEEIKAFSLQLLRHFSIKEYMDDISTQLKTININKVHIFLDDFSEIDFEAQQVFVNTILAPLNNWSEKFFRFKVGSYPKRIFYGEIDKGKINEISLDYFNIYKVKDLPELEEKAIDFLDRLLTRRFEYFLNEKPSIIFQIDSKDNTWESFKELLFYVSMNIPRILGYILSYCYQSALIYNKKITKSLVEEAAQKYYENQILYYFDKTNYLLEAHGENIDRHAQQILMDKIVEKAKDLKVKLATQETLMFKDLPKNRIPSSHFYIKKGYENFFYSLELNYFLTKYYEQSDKDGVVISIYSINYGLCKANNISFGRPKGTEYRKYYISRYFDYNSLLEKYFLAQTKYVCKNCGTIYDNSEIATLNNIGMLCFRGCKENGQIEEKYYFENQNLFGDIDKEVLLPEIDLDILHVLNISIENMLSPTQVALELDCSYQLITKRAIQLEEKELLKKIKTKGKSKYSITEKAKKIYFTK